MEPTQLGTSCLSAEHRLHAIECRLERDPELKVQYHSFMKEYEQLGHMELVIQHEGNNSCYFLPHQPVFKEMSSTTRTKVVFYRSTKTSNGLSLNDILQVGATVQPDLYSIVLRFRTHQVCFKADSQDVSSDCCSSTRQGLTMNLMDILLTNPSKSTDSPLTYGTLSAPFLATRCLKKLANDNEQYPRAAQVLNNDFYFDDLSSGTQP